MNSANIIYINSLLNRWLQAKHVTPKNKTWKKMNNYSQERWRNHLASRPKGISTSALRCCLVAGQKSLRSGWGVLWKPLRGHSHLLGLGISSPSPSLVLCLFPLAYSIFHLIMYPEMLVVFKDISAFLLFLTFCTPGIWSSFLDVWCSSGHSSFFLRQWRSLKHRFISPCTCSLSPPATQGF